VERHKFANPVIKIAEFRVRWLQAPS